MHRQSTVCTTLTMQEINPFAVKLSYPKWHKTYLFFCFFGVTTFLFPNMTTPILGAFRIWHKKKHFISQLMVRVGEQCDNLKISRFTHKYVILNSQKYGKFIL